MSVQSMANRRNAMARHHGADDPRVTELDGEWRTEKIAAVIEQVLVGAPPLSQAQKDRIFALLDGKAVAAS